MKFFKKNQGKWLESIKQISHQGHFSTFLELAENSPVSDHNNNYDDLPSGKCKICPDWVFSSLAEPTRHRCIVHPKSRARDIYVTAGKHVCNFKVSGNPCGEIFSTHYQLIKHKWSTGHKFTRQDHAKKARVEVETNEAKKSNKKHLVNQTIHDFWSSKPLKSKEDFNPSDDNAENKRSDDKEEKCKAVSCIVHDMDEEEDPQWIEYDQCKTWFHMFCVKLAIVPDHYWCLDHSNF